MMLNMPSREIVVTALQVEVQPLALSMIYPADDHSPGRHLKQICNWLKIARVTRRSDLSKHAQFFSPDFAEIIREILLFELGEATTILTEGDSVTAKGTFACCLPLDVS